MLDPDPVPQAAVPNEDVLRLFDEFLDARDAGVEIDVEALCRRAGEHAEELRKRIRFVHELRALSGALLPDDAPVPVLDDPTELGRFRDLTRIGRGGQADVFRAYDPKLDRHVVLKVLRSGFANATGDAREQMLQEGRALARLEHPGIVRVLEIDEADGAAYIAMEYVRGPSLLAVLAHLRSQSRSKASAPDADDSVDGTSAFMSDNDPEQVAASAALLEPIVARCRLILGIARALECCHAHDVVHRDIKPSNVLLERGAQPRLIDFGLAHNDHDRQSTARHANQLIGTPAYLSPEQIEGQRTLESPKSDQWALGVMLYELLTLEHPFVGETRAKTLEQIVRAQPTPPRRLVAEIPDDLQRICLHALARLPENRYPSIAALAADLEAFLEHRAISIEPPTIAQLVRLWVQRNRRDLALAARALALVVAIGLGIWVISLVRERTSTRSTASQVNAAADSLVTIKDFRTQFEACTALLRRARAWDRRLLPRVIGDQVEPDVREAIHTTSRRLARVLSTLKTTRGAEASEAERFKRLLDWKPILSLEEDLCPECEDNAVDRNRGRVTPPSVAPGDKLSVWRFQFGKRINTDFVDVSDLVDLIPGMYRVRRTERSGDFLEADFCLREEDARLQLVLVTPSPQLIATMIRVKELRVGPMRPAQSGQPPTEWLVSAEPFLISPTVVSWGELGHLLPERTAELRQRAQSLRTDELKLSDSDPATLTWREAFECAKNLGVRLPTVAELAVAFRDPDLRLPNQPGLRGEWSSMANYENATERLGVCYASKDLPASPVPLALAMKEDGSTNEFAFRFALSLPR